MKTPLNYNTNSFRSIDYYTGTGTGTGTIKTFTYKLNINKEDFRDKEFKQISVYDSEIRNSDFSNSCHINTIFNQVVLNNVMCREITTPYCRFNISIFKDVDFTGSELSYVNFDLTRFENVKFDNCNMPNVSFANSIFTRVTFTNANLKDSIFVNKGVSPQFLHTKFDNADLTGSTLVKECQYQDFTNVNYADLSKAILDAFSLNKLIEHLQFTLNNTKWMTSDANGLSQNTFIPSDTQLAEIANYQSKLDALNVIGNDQIDIDILGNSINDITEYHG